MRVRVNEERCQGHGLCRLSAPGLFQLAADGCPELAIDID